MRTLHKWHRSLAYNAIFNMSGNGIVAGLTINYD